MTSVGQVHWERRLAGATHRRLGGTDHVAQAAPKVAAAQDVSRACCEGGESKSASKGTNKEAYAEEEGEVVHEQVLAIVDCTHVAQLS